MLLRLLVLGQVACGLAILSVTASGEDWNQWRGPTRTGALSSSPPLISELPAAGLRPLWVSEPIQGARQGGWGSPVVAGDGVFLFAHEREKVKELPPPKYPYLAEDKRGGMSAAEWAEYERHRRDEDQERSKAFAFREHVYRFDANTGKVVWHHRSDSVYTRFPQSGSPTVADGCLYVLGAGRNLYCLDAASGVELWSRRLPGDFRDEYFQSSVLVEGDVAVVVVGHPFGIHARTGELLWESDPRQLVGTHSSPVIWHSQSSPRVIINLAGGKTACLELTTGRELWRVQSECGLATPIVIGDRLLTYGNSRQKGLRCFRLTETGAEELWRFHGTQDKGGSPVVMGEFVYVQGERRLACVNLESGRAEWSANLDLATPQYTSLIAADGKVFYAYDGLTGFHATPDGFEPFLQARFNKDGLMASDETHRRLLNLDEIESQPNGQEQALRIMEREVNRHGPLKCSTPAIAEGRLYIRGANTLLCYDLRAASPIAAAAQP